MNNTLIKKRSKSLKLKNSNKRQKNYRKSKNYKKSRKCKKYRKYKKYRKSNKNLKGGSSKLEFEINPPKDPNYKTHSCWTNMNDNCKEIYNRIFNNDYLYLRQSISKINRYNYEKEKDYSDFPQKRIETLIKETKKTLDLLYPGGTLAKAASSQSEINNDILKNEIDISILEKLQEDLGLKIKQIEFDLQKFWKTKPSLQARELDPDYSRHRCWKIRNFEKEVWESDCEVLYDTFEKKISGELDTLKDEEIMTKMTNIVKSLNSMYEDKKLKKDLENNLLVLQLELQHALYNNLIFNHRT